MSKTTRHEPTQKPKKPRQIKRERIAELLDQVGYQPQSRPDPVFWNPMG